MITINIPDELIVFIGGVIFGVMFGVAICPSKT